MSGKHHDPASKGVSRSLRVALLVNIGLAAVAATGAHLSSSLALWSDAGHLLVDVGGVITVLIALALGRRRPDKRHTFGHRRLEVFAAALNSGFLLLIAGGIVVAALSRFGHPHPVNSRLMLLTASVTCVGNLACAIYLWRAKGGIGGRAALLDMLADAVASIGVLLAAGLIRLTGRDEIDPVISLVIAGLIVIGALKLLLESAHVLLEGVPEGLNIDRLREALLGEAGVTDVHDLHVWAITSGESSLSAHVVHCTADPDGLRRRLAALLEENFEIHHHTLQLESAGCGGAELHD